MRISDWSSDVCSSDLMIRAIRRVFLIVIGGLLVIAAILVGGGYLWMRGSLPETEGEIRIASLEAPVTVRRHADGTVRIQAAHEHDLSIGRASWRERGWQYV